MKFIRLIIGFAFVFLLVSVLITVYLGPNDLLFCNGPTAEGKCRKADAIVVISGGDTSARTAEAIKLYQQGYASTLILSGAAADKSGPSNAQAMQQQAVNAGVPGVNTIIEENSETTDQNAQNTMALVKQRGYTSIILVTSAYHQRRALLEFQHYGKDINIRSHPISEDKDWNKFWFLTPWGWNLAGSEVVKTMITALGGTN